MFWKASRNSFGRVFRKIASNFGSHDVNAAVDWSIPENGFDNFSCLTSDV
jgi:hypothetical protein